MRIAAGKRIAIVGLLYAAAGAGGALGAIAMGRYQRRLSPVAAITIYALNVPLLGALALVHQAALALLVLACSTVTMTVGDLIFAVYVQRQVPAAEQGRAFGLLFWFFAVGQLTGAMLGVGVSSADAVPALLRVSLAVLPFIFTGLLLYLRSMGAATARAGAEAPATVA